MSVLLDYICALLILTGGVFAISAAVGVIRFPDIYSRNHSASKAGTMGSGLILVVVALHASDVSIVMRALAGIAFFLLTAPVAAHLLARAAYVRGFQPSSNTVVDELKGKYQKEDEAIKCNSHY
jgi:multicomponent Na+:H+ antiporter subunit G